MALLLVSVFVGCRDAKPPIAKTSEPDSETAAAGDSGAGEQGATNPSGAQAMPEEASDQSPFTGLGEPGDECRTDDDCGLHCCGCQEGVFLCDFGHCAFTETTICADAACCFDNFFGCDSMCDSDTPWSDYDGSCAGVDCAPSFGDPVEGRFFSVHGCCTSDGDVSLSEPGVRCGVDAVVLGVLEPGYCVQLNRPGSPDDSCPARDLPDLSSVTLPGCCTSAGKCGVLHDVLGCTYRFLSPGDDCVFDADRAGADP